jgi:hypothetical protein
MPEFVEAYLDEQSACAREQALREVMNPDYDETGVFEVCINLPSAPGT